MTYSWRYIISKEMKRNQDSWDYLVGHTFNNLDFSPPDIDEELDNIGCLWTQDYIYVPDKFNENIPWEAEFFIKSYPLRPPQELDYGFGYTITKSSINEGGVTHIEEMALNYVSAGEKK